MNQRLQSITSDRPALVAAIALASLPILIFLPQVLGFSTFYHHDLQFYFFPYHKVAADIIRSGHLPLWNPYPFGGMPLIGDGQTALFYPLNWLYLILRGAHAMSLGIVLNFCVAAIGMFLFARQLRLSLPATALAAIAFTFNGFLVARMGHPSIMAGASLIPLVFWAADRTIGSASAGRLIVLSIFIALQMICGHPQIPVYTAMALGIYVLLVKPAAILRILGAYVLAAGLSAVQLLPWLELISQSPRAAGASYEFVTADSVTGISWLFMLFPYAIGGMRQTFLQGGTIWDIPVYSGERLGYVGILPLMLAIYAVTTIKLRTPSPNQRAGRSRSEDAGMGGPLSWIAGRGDQEKRLLALAIIAAIALLAAAGAGTPFGRLLYLLPLVGKLRGYSRAIGIAAFVLSVLAGFGAEKLFRRETRTWRAAVIAAIVMLVMLILLAAAPLMRYGGPIPGVNAALHTCLNFRMPNGYLPITFALASVAAIVWASMRPSRAAAVALVAIALLDGAGFAWSFCATTDPVVFAQTPPSVDFLKKQPGPFRVAVFLDGDRIRPEIAQRQLAVSWALPYGIEDVNGFNSLQPRRHMEFLYGPQSQDISYGWLPDERGDLLRPPSNLLNQLDARFALIPMRFLVNVGDWWKRVYADEQVTIYQNPAPYGRAFFAKQVVSGLSAAMTLKIVRSPTFPSNRIALVEGMEDAAAAALTSVSDADPKLLRRSPDDVQFIAPSVSYPPYDPPASLTFTQRTPNAIEFETSVTRPRLAVLSEIDFPGWHAERIAPDGTIDPVEIYRANYLFRAIEVPEGKGTKFRMLYRPAIFYSGALLTLLCIAGCTLTLLAPSRPRLGSILQRCGRWFIGVFGARSILVPERCAADNWLSTNLLVIAAMGLGIAIQLRDGLITPAGIALLAMACAAALAAVCVARVTRWRHWRRARLVQPEALLLPLAVVTSFVLMFATVPGTYLRITGFEVFRPFPIMLGLAAMLAATALTEKPPLGRVTLPVILVLFLAIGTWVLSQSPKPTIDVFLFQRDAVEAVLHGRNPYAMSFRNPYGAEGSWLYAADVLRAGRLMFGYPYTPLTLLFTTPAQFFLNDYRYGQLIALALAAALIAYARPSRTSMLAALLLLFSPRSFFVIEQGWTEPITVLLLAATVFCAFRLPRALPYVLGMLLVSKQYMPAAAALVPLLVDRRQWRGVFIRAAIAAALVTLPLVLLNPSAFWRSAVALQFKQPFRFDSLSFLAAISEVKYAAGQPPLGTPPAGAAVIAFLALIAGAGLALWRLRGRPSPRSFATGVALMFLLFFAFNKQAFANYYFLVFAACWCAVAAEDEPELTSRPAMVR